MIEEFISAYLLLFVVFCKLIHMSDFDTIIKGKLYLAGAWLPLTCPQKLKNEGVTHIVDLANDMKNIKRCHDDFKYLIIDIDDSKTSSEPLKKKFSEIHKFINDGIKNGKVFVHCNCGVSRSATVVISYLMGEKQYSLKDAFLLVKKARNIIQPNLEFMKMLIDYELSLTKTNTFSLEDYKMYLYE